MKGMTIRLYWVLLAFLCGCSYSQKNVKSDEQLNLSYDGVWAENEEANASFTIKGDTIIDFEHGDRMYFKVLGDTMIIDYDDFVGRHLILKHTSDSLILRNEDGSITRLYKR